MRNVVVLLLLILVQTRHASKKSVMAALRDTIELSNSENPGSVTGSTLTQAQKDSVLQLHNAFRSMVKPAASNMLRMMWDDDLEKISSDFANKCIVAHNPDRHKLAKNYDWVGENIAWGTGTCGDKECGDVFEGVKRWFSESKSYTYLTGQCSGKCTLYTQMVWWESNKLGCGAKRCGDRTILVCNYAPGGNYVGQRPYKTGKVCSECPTGLVCEDNLCTEPKKTTELATALDTTTAKEVPKKEPPTATATGESECPGGVAKKEDLSTGVPVLICPPLIAQIANALNTPTEPPSVAEDHTLPAGWTELPMRLTQVDSGITPAIWGINGKHELYSLNTNNALKKIDGTMHHVSAGQAGVWAVGLLGNVFYRKGEAGDSDDVNAREGVPPLWEKIPGNLKQIDSGTTGVVWGVNRFNRIFCRIGVDKSRPEGTGWMRIEGSMKYVSCGEYGCWAVNKRDNVYFRVGITEALPQGTQWTVVPGRLRMVESGPAGLTVGLSDTSDLFVRQGVTPQKPEGVKWVKLNLKLAHVTVGDKGIIGILSDGTVAVHRDINSFIYQTPTIAPTDSGLLPSRASPLEAVTAIKPTTAAVVNESPVTLQTLEGSLETLQQLNPSPPQTGSLTEKDQLHISPDMAAKILKLIEQKGNQFEDAHKAAAAAAALSRNGTIGTLNALSQKSDETPLAPPSEADVQLKNTSSLEGTPKPFSPPLPGPAPEAPATPEPSETKATSQDQEEKAHAAGEPADQKEDTTPSPSDALISPTEPPAVPVAVATTTKAAPTTVKPSPVETQPPTTRLKTSRRLTTQPKTTNKPSTPAAAAIAAYPQPKLPTHRPPTTRPRTTSSLLTKTHSNWVHRVATTTPAPAVQPPAAAVNPPAVLPPPSATAAVPTTLPPPVPLGQRIVAHSGQIVPTTQPPTAINAALKHTYAAPHAALNVPTPVMFHGKKPAAAGGKINVHKVVMLGGLHLSQQPQPLLHQAAVPLQMTRSCCAIPDSVCPIPKDCVGYIECHGYHGNYKSCDRGKMFNPITNICDYPRNVDCESVKASSINGASSTTTTTPVTPLLTTTTNAILSNATNNATTSTTSTTPSTTTVGKESTTTVASVIAGNQAPQLAALQHAPGAQRDETSKLDAKQTSVQPRVKRPHTDDDGVLREVWFGLGLSPLLTLLTNNPRFPTNPDEYIVLDKFEAPPNAGDGYGQRLSTYYKAPETGEYIFYMSCDNECELWISPDTEEIHSNLILELKHGHFTSFRQWHKYPSEQTSRPIYLQAGEYYFIESFMKEGAGGDDLSIGVKLPGGEFDLPISKNLYLVPGDASTGSLTRKVGQSVLLPQSEETVLKLPPPVQQQQQQTQQQQTQQQQTQQQLQQTQQVTSTSQGASLVSSPTLQQSYSQPVPVAQTVSVMSPEEAATMGPQPGQTAEQWLAANKAPVSTMSLAKYKQQAGIVPGAEMYSHNNDGELEAFEQQTSQHYRSSVKRNSIGRANHSAIR